MLETDVLFAHIKEEDWLKKDAETILEEVVSGRLGQVLASREALHELYYLLARSNLAAGDILSKVGALTSIANLVGVPTATDTDLLALSLMATYGLTSVFDSYHAATCLLEDTSHEIISTDDIYDKIGRIKRKDPRLLASEIRLRREKEETGKRRKPD